MNIRSYFTLFWYLTITTGTSFAQSIGTPRNIKSSTVSFPIRTSDNGRYLVDKKNQPFPILGRTAWFVISQPVGGYRTFIAHTVSLGYNSIEIMGITHDPRANHPPFNGDNDLPFLKQLNGTVI